MPERTCTGCKRTDEKTRMIRVVKTGDGAAMDVRQRMPGRGAYVHADAACVARAMSRGGLARTLKGPVPASLLSLLSEEVKVR